MRRGTQLPPNLNCGRQAQRTESHPRSSGGSVLTSKKLKTKTKKRSLRQIRHQRAQSKTRYVGSDPPKADQALRPNWAGNLHVSPRLGFTLVSPCRHWGGENYTPTEFAHSPVAEVWATATCTHSQRSCKVFCSLSPLGHRSTPRPLCGSALDEH